MATQEVWDNYHSNNPDKGTDEDIRSMIYDCVDVVKTLERMYGTDRASLVVRGILIDYLSLTGMAKARDIVYPSL